MKNNNKKKKEKKRLSRKRKYGGNETYADKLVEKIGERSRSRVETILHRTLETENADTRQPIRNRWTAVGTSYGWQFDRRDRFAAAIAFTWGHCTASRLRNRRTASSRTTGRKSSWVRRLVRNNRRSMDNSCCRISRKRRPVCAWTARPRTPAGRFLLGSCSRTRRSASSCLEPSSTTTTQRPRRQTIDHLCKLLLSWDVRRFRPSVVCTILLYNLLDDCFHSEKFSFFVCSLFNLWLNICDYNLIHIWFIRYSNVSSHAEKKKWKVTTEQEEYYMNRVGQKSPSAKINPQFLFYYMFFFFNI